MIKTIPSGKSIYNFNVNEAPGIGVLKIKDMFANNQYFIRGYHFQKNIPHVVIM